MLINGLPLLLLSKVIFVLHFVSTLCAALKNYACLSTPFSWFVQCKGWKQKSYALLLLANKSVLHFSFASAGLSSIPRLLFYTGAPGCINDSILTGMQFVDGFESFFFVSRWSMHQLVISWFMKFLHGIMKTIFRNYTGLQNHFFHMLKIIYTFCSFYILMILGYDISIMILGYDILISELSLPEI